MAAPGIGERLRGARQARGLSLDDIEAGTRIRRRYLEALEAEAFDEIPGPAYVRGFLGAYAAYLGLPPDEIARMRPGVETGSLLPHGAPGDLRITPVARGSRTRRVVMGAAVVLAIAAAVVAYLLYGQFAGTPARGSLGGAHQGKSRDLLAALEHTLIPSAQVRSGPRSVEPRSAAGTARPSAASAAAQPAVPQPAVPQPAGPSLSGAPRSGSPASPRATGGGAVRTPASAALRSPSPATWGPVTPARPEGSTVPAAGTPAPAVAPGAPGGPLTSPLRVVLVVTDRSWIRTVADGITVFEGFLGAGDQQAWQAENRLSLTIGNASAVDVTVNGRSLGRLGNPGDVVAETFTVGSPVGR